MGHGVYAVKKTILFLIFLFCLAVDLQATDNITTVAATTYDNGLLNFDYPKAVYIASQNKTFIVIHNYSTSCARIGVYDHSTGTMGSLTTITTTAPTGDHSSPSILIDPSGYIYVFYTTTMRSTIRYKKSTNPYDVTAWGAEQTIPVGGAYTGYTYVQVFWWNSTIYLFANRNTGDPILVYDECYATSTDGVNWSAFTQLTNFGEYGGSPYAVVNMDQSSGNFHIAWTWSSGSQVNVYYFKFNPITGYNYKRDGTQIGYATTATCDLVHNSASSGKDAMIYAVQVINDDPILAYSSGTAGASAWTVNTARYVDGSWNNITLKSNYSTNYDAGYYVTISIFANSSTNIDALVHSSDQQAVEHYNTTDGGVTWALVDTVQSNSHGYGNMWPVYKGNTLLKMLFGPEGASVWTGTTYAWGETPLPSSISCGSRGSGIRMN